MSGAGDLLGTLGQVAPSALAGYGRGQARGLQYQQQEAYRQQQLQGLQDYRQQLIELQKAAQQAKEHLAEHQADQKELARLTDALLKDPHSLQARGQLEPTLMQWRGLYQKVHPGEPVPNFFGETFLPAGPEMETVPGLETSAPPRFVEDVSGYAYEPEAARAQMGLGALPGVGGEFRSSEGVQGYPEFKRTVMKPARFEGIPEIPLSEVEQSKKEAYQSLIDRRAKQNLFTDEQILRYQLERNPRLAKLYWDTRVLMQRERDIPAARAQADQRLQIMADALHVNSERLRAWIEDQNRDAVLQFEGLQSIDALRQSEIDRNAAYLKNLKTQIPEAVWKEILPLWRGYQQINPLSGRPFSPAEREPYRQGIIAKYRQYGLDPRPLLHPGEPGYDPSFTLGGAPGSALQAPGGEGAPPPEPGAGRLEPGASPEGYTDEFAPAGLPPPAARGAGMPDLPAVGGWPDQIAPAAAAPGGQPAPRTAQLKGFTLPGTPRYTHHGTTLPPSLPKGMEITAGDFQAVKQMVSGPKDKKRGSLFRQFLSSPKTPKRIRQKALYTYWFLYERPYQGD